MRRWRGSAVSRVQHSADPGVQQEAAAEDAVGAEAGERLDDAAAADDQRALREKCHRV